LSLDKYGAGQDPYCYPGTGVLRNLIDIHDDEILAVAEREITMVAANEIEFIPPPYDLKHLCRIHAQLFGDLYDWAGELRTIDIAKGGTRFCWVSRIRPEANKIFERLKQANWFEGLSRTALVPLIAEFYGDLNMVHPFREGNGRAQRLLFEHLIINAGYQIDWWPVSEAEWLQANIDSVDCDYTALAGIFERCIGQAIPTDI
jgi:cell filamentation protein